MSDDWPDSGLDRTDRALMALMVFGGWAVFVIGLILLGSAPDGG